ncbi:MAG: tripartite tricarboxylate transporter permease [Cardiobacteriaceae bacterium]|nr:tripartite tricarboxylate transporter permease [Cardiobacteriaceae bacterium]
MEALRYFLSAWTNGELLALTAAGVFAGIYIGALPGLSVTMAVSILISFTFSWEVEQALALMVGVFCGGVYGGSRTAILLNIPGTPAAVATAFDGYPLAKLGEAGQAIGLSTVMSVLSGLFGVAVLALFAPAISEAALHFAPRDYLLIALFGLLLVGSLSGESLARGIFAAALGAWIGLIGLDQFTAQPRLTFGSEALLGGVHYVVVMIGLFGMSEALYQLHHIDARPIRQALGKGMVRWPLVRRFLPLSLKSSAIGVVIGALPGTGGDIAALFAYDHAKRTVKNPSRPFGQGAYEGLVAPECANSAAVAGAFIPMLTLGMPGDAVTAVMIGALVVHGLEPGPMMMLSSPHMFWFIVGALVLAHGFLLVFGLLGVRLFARMVEWPRAMLVPLIVMLCVVGTYAINGAIVDVYWMVAFGIFGYFLKRFRFELGPVILGVILAPLMDRSYRQAMEAVGNQPGAFLLDLVRHPLSLAMILLMGFVLWRRRT